MVSSSEGMRLGRGWRVGATALALAGTLVLARPGVCATPRASEADVQAVVLTKILLFTDVDGLRGRDAALDVFVLGESGLGDRLELALDDLEAAHGAVRLQRIASSDGLDDAGILVLGEAAGEDLCTLVRRARELGILTVSQDNERTREGVMVGLGVERSRVAIWINDGEADRAAIPLNSRLLRLARIVESRQECD